MLKSSFIEHNYGDNLKIPNSIEKALLSLYSVDKISDLKSSYKDNMSQKMKMFASFDNYANKHKEYTLYYFIVNFYKIWRPLLDLYYSGQLNENINVLEVGVGPGSATFGLIEFYKHLAIENLNKEFNLKFTLIEKEKEFIDIFNVIFNFYSKDLPDNLKISYICVRKLIDKNFSLSSFSDEFDLIFESNMFNSNEKISKESIDVFLNQSQLKLKKHGSIIFIEPADKKLINSLQYIREQSTNNNLKIFSPCSCNILCNRLCMAKTFIPISNIIPELKKFNIISNNKNFHYFEYVILRKDGLIKNILEKNLFSLSQTSSHIGENININAFILFATKKGNVFRIKICDGSNMKEDVWVTLPISLFHKYQITELEINRGCIIKISKGKINTAQDIECNEKSKVTIRR